MSILALRPFVSKRVWNRSRKVMGRVLNVRTGHFRLSGLVASSNHEYIYNPHITADGTYYCDCDGFQSSYNVEQLCSHLLAILRQASYEGQDIEKFIKGLKGEFNEDDLMKVYETSIEGYNQLFDGGLQAGRHLTGLVAPPETGKSYMIAQFAVDMAEKYNLNTLIIDTEGGFGPKWLELIAAHRGIDIDVQFIEFPMKVAISSDKGVDVLTPDFKYKDLKYIVTKKPTVYIIDLRHVVKLTTFLGRPQKFKIKSGVVEPLEAGNSRSIYDSPIGEIIQKCNIGFIALDSLSSPVESLFTGGQINYRTRAKVEQVILGRAQDIIDEFGLCFLTAVHATIQHNNPHADPGLVGGKAVLHNIKYVAYLEKYKGKAVAKKAKVDWRNLRRIQIFRHPYTTPWRKEFYLLTTDHGVVDFYKPED